jgi:hypothetical protein
MGASGKWIKTLVGLKPEKEKHGGGGGGKGRKWSRLWRTSSGGRGAASASAAASEVSETSSSTAAAAEALSSAVAAVVRATPKDFRVIRQEWAALRIQTAFRGFLVRPPPPVRPSLGSAREISASFSRISVSRPGGR